MAEPRKKDYWLFKNTKKGSIDAAYLRENEAALKIAYAHFMGNTKASLKVGYTAVFDLEYNGKNKTDIILSKMFENVDNAKKTIMYMKQNVVNGYKLSDFSESSDSSSSSDESSNETDSNNDNDASTFDIAGYTIVEKNGSSNNENKKRPCKQSSSEKNKRQKKSNDQIKTSNANITYNEKNNNKITLTSVELGTELFSNSNGKLSSSNSFSIGNTFGEFDLSKKGIYKDILNAFAEFMNTEYNQHNSKLKLSINHGDGTLYFRKSIKDGFMKLTEETLKKLIETKSKLILAYANCKEDNTIFTKQEYDASIKTTKIENTPVVFKIVIPLKKKIFR